MDIKFNEEELRMLINGLGFLIVHNGTNYEYLEAIRKLKSSLKLELEQFQTKLEVQSWI